MTIFSFAKHFGGIRFDIQGDEHGPEVEEHIKSTSSDAVVIFDLREIRYLGYSYAKPSLRRLFEMRNRGEYATRRFFITAPLEGDLLDGVAAAFSEKKMAAYAVDAPDRLGKSGKLIGAVTPALQETFDLLLQRGAMSTGDLARALDTSPQNAKNRVDRLVNQGLAVREKVSSETGGTEWINRIV